MKQVQKAIQNRKMLSGSKHSHQQDGEIRHEYITIYPLIATGVEGAVIRMDDVTERVRIDEMIVQSEKMLSVGGLAAGMAHEINNPLAGIIQNSYVLTNRLTGENIPANLKAAQKMGTSMETIRGFMEIRGIPKILDRICKSGSRAAEIITNMLSFARKSDSGKSSHDIRKLLDQCVVLAGADYDLKKKYDFRLIAILREYDEDLPRVSCESGKIQQVLLNILRNGAEAMQDEAGWLDSEPRFILRLKHENQEGLVCIEIEDNGPGMTEEIRKRVFEPFFTTKPTGRGTGLGLSVSYFIITENHNGEMSVESVPGKYTKFRICLPAERSNTFSTK